MPSNNINFDVAVNNQDALGKFKALSTSLMAVNKQLTQINALAAKASSAAAGAAGAAAAPMKGYSQYMTPFAGKINVGEKLKLVGGEAKAASGHVKNLNGGLMGMAKSAIGIMSVYFVITKLIKAVKESVDQFRELELRMAEIATITADEDLFQLQAAQGGIEALSKSYGQAVGDLSKGFYDIVSAAFAAEDALNLLNTATKASIAGLSDVRTSVDIFTSVLNSYGMSVEQATKLSDELFFAVKRGKFQFEDLETALGYVVPIAAQAGIAFDEIVASLTTATRAGLHLDMAARGLALMIQNWVNPTDQASQAAQEFGVHMDAISLRAGGLKGVIEELQLATSVYGKSILAELVPNMRSLRVAMVLAGDVGAEGFLRDLQDLETVAGSTDRALEKISETASFTANILKEEMSDVARDVGDELNEFIVLPLQGALVNLGKIVNLAAKGFQQIPLLIPSDSKNKWEDFGKWREQSKYIQSGQMKKYWQEMIDGSDTAGEKLVTYTKLLQQQEYYANELNKYKNTDASELFPDLAAGEAWAMASNYIDIYSAALEQIPTLLSQVESEANLIVGSIDEWEQETSGFMETLLQVENSIDEIREKIEEPVTYGWGAYENTVKGSLGLELQQLEVKQRLADVQHDVDMGLQWSDYTYKVLNSDMQDAISIMRNYTEAQEEQRKSTQLMNFAMRELNIQMLELQIIGMIRRRGNTRSEKKLMKEIQIEQQKLRLENMQSEHQANAETWSIYEEKKQIIDDYISKLKEESYQANYTYDYEREQLKKQIGYEQELLTLREQQYTDTQDSIFQSTVDFYSDIAALVESDEVKSAMGILGIDVDQLMQTAQNLMGTNGVSPMQKIEAANPTVGAVIRTATSGNSRDLAELLGQNALSRINTGRSFKRGTEYIPEDGWYKLHRGEKVARSQDVGENTSVVVNVSGVTIRESLSSDDLGALVAQAAYKGIMNSKSGKSKYRMR